MEPLFDSGLIDRYYFPGVFVISLLLFILDTVPIMYRVKLLFARMHAYV